MNTLMSLVSPRSTAASGPNVRETSKSAAPDLTGWLHKMGEGNKAFKRRWFVMTGKSLSYFEDDSPTAKSKGDVDLHGSTCEIATANPGRFRIEMTVNDKGGRGRTYVLEAEEEATRDKWMAALWLASAKELKGAPPFPDNVTLEGVVGACPERTWRDEWVPMRMEQLRSVGASNASRKECGPGGSESIETWAKMRVASIGWKTGAGWPQEHALAYTLLTSSNRAALARSVRERSPKYAASLHLITRALGERVDDLLQPAPDLYYHLLGQNGLATNDAAWAALLAPSAGPGTTTVLTSPAIGRDDAACFPASNGTCRGYHDKYIVGVAGDSKTQYTHILSPSPVVHFVSEASLRESDTAPARHRTLVQVDGTSSRWEVPPLATVRLLSVTPPGEWSAYGNTVQQTRFTVSVEWSAASEPAAAAPAPAAVDVS